MSQSETELDTHISGDAKMINNKEHNVVCKSILCCNFPFYQYHLREIGFALATTIITIFRVPTHLGITYLSLIQFIISLISALFGLAITILHFKHNVNKHIFLETLRSFKGFIIFINVILVVIIDMIVTFAYHEFSSWKGPIYICGDIAWICYSLIILSMDASNNMSRLVRFCGPLLLSLNLFYNIYLRTFITPNVILFTINGQTTSTNELQTIFYIELLTFILTLVISPIRDPKHERCVFLRKNKVRAHYIPWLVKYFHTGLYRQQTPSSQFTRASSNSRNKLDVIAPFEVQIQKSAPLQILAGKQKHKVSVEEDLRRPLIHSKTVNPTRSSSPSNFSVQSSNSLLAGIRSAKYTSASSWEVMQHVPRIHIFVVYVILGLTTASMFVLEECKEIWQQIILSIATSIAIILSGYLIKKYFSIPLKLLSLTTQFKLSLCVLSVFIIFVSNILEIIFMEKTTESGSNRICLFCFNMVYCTSVLLCLVRDGLIYPIWFSWFLFLSVLAINSYNIIYLDYFEGPASTNSELDYHSYLTLKPISQNPLFRRSQHYAYSQILLILVYLLYSLVHDKDHKYFGLIFDARLRSS